MNQPLSFALLTLFLLCASPALPGQEAPAPERLYHDPLLTLTEHTDDVGRSVLTAYERFDPIGLLKDISSIEARLGSEEELAQDRYVLAQGHVSLALIRRFYEKHASADMPAALKRLSPDDIAEKGIAHASVFQKLHADHADIRRVHGELVSTQIRGMFGGMTKGPEAKRIMAAAKKLDPKNGWVQFSSARMHYHNPAIAGGDKDLALEELRELQEYMDPFRVRLYLSLTYSAKEMYPQARYWALKAKALAPENRDLQVLAQEINAHIAEGKRS